MIIRTSLARVVAVLKEELENIQQEFDNRNSVARCCRDFNDAEQSVYYKVLDDIEQAFWLFSEGQEDELAILDKAMKEREEVRP